MEPEGSLPHSQQPATCPYPEPYQSTPCPTPVPLLAHHVPCSKSHVPCPLLKLYQTISPGPRLCIVLRNMVICYGEELLAPRPTPKLEDHPLSAVRDCLFNIFAATLHICRPFLHPQPEDAPCRGDRDRLIVVTGTDLSW
jgi:hypothetical protein